LRPPCELQAEQPSQKQGHLQPRLPEQVLSKIPDAFNHGHNEDPVHQEEVEEEDVSSLSAEENEDDKTNIDREQEQEHGQEEEEEEEQSKTHQKVSQKIASRRSGAASIPDSPPPARRIGAQNLVIPNQFYYFPNTITAYAYFLHRAKVSFSRETRPALCGLTPQGMIQHRSTLSAVNLCRNR
jgi:hypothetical protein